MPESFPALNDPDIDRKINEEFSKNTINAV